MSDSSDVAANSLLPTLLGVLFIGLKLAGIITWPWVWVLAPFWIPIVLVAVIFILIFIIALVSLFFKDIARERKRNKAWDALKKK